MKYVVFVGDGMADYPIESLDGRTPLESAKTPHLDEIARRGQVGLSATIPDGLPPGSDVGNLAILGFDPQKYYCGRAPYEAAAQGIDLAAHQVAFRCNLVMVDDETMVDYSAGHISTTEASVLIEDLQTALGDDGVRLYPGVSYRHLLVVSCGHGQAASLDPTALVNTKCTPPHDLTGKSVRGQWPRGPAADLLKSLMETSIRTLSDHDVNQVRIDLGENPASMIWLWGQGQRPTLPDFATTYGPRGSIISAVDLVKGVGSMVGLRVIDVPGATGYYDTDYDAKARYGLDALAEDDFLFLHLEAIDEAGHNGDLREKILALERFDQQIVGPVLRGLEAMGDHRVLLMPDHLTPVTLRTHVSDPVPVAVCGTGIPADAVEVYSEPAAANGALGIKQAHQIMGRLMQPNWS